MGFGKLFFPLRIGARAQYGVSMKFCTVVVQAFPASQNFDESGKIPQPFSKHPSFPKKN